jgi:hypothetical protein
MKRVIMILAAGLFALAACDNKPDPKTDDPSASKNATTTGASAAVPTPTVAAPPTISEGDLSTPADFEESVEKSITKTNYKTELASLETDISKE